MERVVVWGASGHGKVVADILRCEGRYEIVGFLDDGDPRPRPFADSEVLGPGALLPSLDATHVLVAIGNCETRLRLGDVARSHGLLLATAIHPRATLARDVVVGAGTVVAAHAVVNPGSRVGESVIVNTGATVDHDNVLDDGVHVCPGAHLAGTVRVGRGSWIGVGSIVKNDVSIGARTMVGAGSLVLHDLPDDVVAYGHPARVIRPR